MQLVEYIKDTQEKGMYWVIVHPDRRDGRKWAYCFSRCRKPLSREQRVKLYLVVRDDLKDFRITPTVIKRLRKTGSID